MNYSMTVVTRGFSDDPTVLVDGQIELVIISRLVPPERLVFWCRDGIKDYGLPEMREHIDCPTRKGRFWIKE